MLNRIHQNFIKNLPFFGVFLVFITILISIISKDTKINLHFEYNQYYNAFFDVFFKYITQLIELVPLIVLFIVLLLTTKIKWSIITLICYLFSGGVTQLLKQYFNTDRPGKVLEIFDLHYVEGIVIKQHYSFPSGHATAAFALMLCLTLTVKNKWWGLLFGFIACLVAFSRVYLSQHFFIDILVGSIIGTCLTLILFSILEKVNFGAWANKKLLSTI